MCTHVESKKLVLFKFSEVFNGQATSGTQTLIDECVCANKVNM